jgi:hypothetical protein
MTSFFENRAGIAAPVEIVWEILYDVERWAEWNPLYVEAEGQVRIGEVLTVKQVLPGDEPEVLKPRITEWVPQSHIYWHLSWLGGLVKVQRYFELEAVSETGSIFANGEVFRGLLGPYVGNRLRQRLRKGYGLMGEAIRVRAEALWIERGGKPISQS